MSQSVAEPQRLQAHVPADLHEDRIDVDHGACRPDQIDLTLNIPSETDRWTTGGRALGDRTEPYASVRSQCYRGVMITIRAEEVRIPRHAREAVARHERVVVVNHERPAFVIMHPDDTAAVIMHPDDTAADSPTARRGRPLREALGLLAGAALPDPGFADDMEAVLADVGSTPDDPWARS